MAELNRSKEKPPSVICCVAEPRSLDSREDKTVFLKSIDMFGKDGEDGEHGLNGASGSHGVFFLSVFILFLFLFLFWSLSFCLF